MSARRKLHLGLLCGMVANQQADQDLRGPRASPGKAVV